MKRKITQPGPVTDGELIPRVFVPVEAALAAFEGAPSVPADRFRKDVDALLDQRATSRG